MDEFSLLCLDEVKRLASLGGEKKTYMVKDYRLEVSFGINLDSFLISAENVSQAWLVFKTSVLPTCRAILPVYMFESKEYLSVDFPNLTERELAIESARQEIEMFSSEIEECNAPNIFLYQSEMSEDHVSLLWDGVCKNR
jgi:hypothetical protein